MMEIEFPENENIDEKLTLFFQALQSVNFKEINIESWYQELFENQNRSEGEELVFQTMHHNRSRYSDSLLEFNSQLDCKLEELGLPKRIPRPLYYDWDSRPISHWEYTFKFSFFPRHVGEDQIENYRISTVWLGINHFFAGHQTPIIFETMIFNDTQPDDELNFYQERYSSLYEAEQGHSLACGMVRTKLAEILDNGCHD